MASSGRPSRRGDGDSGVRITRSGADRAVVPIVGAIAVAAVVAWFYFGSSASPPAAREANAPPHDAAAPGATAASRVPPDARAADETQRIPSARAAEIAARIRQRREERAIERRDKVEPKFTLNPPGEHGGLEAFPPPGTKPILKGLVVPDDFELPEGYVRHFQTTDDGRRLPPILMFHPDVAGVDENGNPLTDPKDRIVPPDMVPPGFPLRPLDPDTDAQTAPSEGRIRRPDPGPARGQR